LTAKVADDVARAAITERDVAREQMEDFSFMSRYSDYAMEEVRSLQREAGISWNRWVVVENQLVGERVDHHDDVVDGRPTVHFMQRPAHAQLVEICRETARDPETASDLIIFYKERCQLFHSGLQRMSTRERGSKIRRNVADLAL